MRKAFSEQRRLDCCDVLGVQLNLECRRRDHPHPKGLAADLQPARIPRPDSHRALRHIMGIGDWCEECAFSWRRIRDNLCRLKPATIEKISHLIVAEGHRLQPEAAQRMRADSFVMETNIHWPTESTLIRDGVRKITELCVSIATLLQQDGWRQSTHLFKRVRFKRLTATRVVISCPLAEDQDTNRRTIGLSSSVISSDRPAARDST